MLFNSLLFVLLVTLSVTEAALTVKSLKQTANACTIKSHGSLAVLKYEGEGDKSTPYVKELVCKEGFKKGFFGKKKTRKSYELGAFTNRNLLAPFFKDWVPRKGHLQNAFNCVSAARHLHNKLKTIYLRSKKWWYRVPGRASYRFMEFMCSLKYQEDGPALFMKLLDSGAHSQVIIGKLKAAKEGFNEMHDAAVADGEEGEMDEEEEEEAQEEEE